MNNNKELVVNPLKRTAWKCPYYGCKQYKLTKKAIQKHMEKCFFNPSNRACYSCKGNLYNRDDECKYLTPKNIILKAGCFEYRKIKIERLYNPESGYSDCFCTKIITDSLTKKDNKYIICRINCPYYEVKERSKQ